VVRALWRDEKPGGRRNVAMNLAGLVRPSGAGSFVGDDQEQRSYNRCFAKSGIQPLAGDSFQASRPPLSCASFSANQQMMRLDMNRSMPSPTPTIRPSDAPRRSADVSVVVLSDYAKGVLTEQLPGHSFQRRASLNIPVLIDPKNRQFCSLSWQRNLPNLRNFLRATENRLRAGSSAYLAQAQLPSLQMEFMR